jgi:hypothetical protein
MINRILFVLLAAIVMAGVWSGCKEDPPASLYDPTYVSGPQPVVSGISPSTGALAGVTTLTISGQNFSAVGGNNLVFFDKTLVTVLSATVSQLTVKAPNLPKDSIVVKVAVAGSDLYSGAFYYNLGLAANEKYVSYTTGEEGVGIEADTAGNLYVSMITTAGGIGVKKYTPAGVRTDYSPILSSAVASWKNMKFGSGGALFCTAPGRAILFRIPPGGGTPAIWLSGGGLGVLADLDFDANGNIWASGTNGNIYRVSPTKTVKVFTCPGTMRAIRVYNNAVYVGGKRDSLEKVWKFPIIGTDSLDAEQEYFNLSSVYGANASGVYAMTFSSDGDLFIGTDNAEGVRVVHPGKTSEAFYTGLLKGATVSMTWGKGNDLLQSRSATPGPSTTVKINAQNTGAPYYGRLLP